MEAPEILVQFGIHKTRADKQMTKHASLLPTSGELVIYQSEDGRIRLETRLENETLWLTQQQMADLFQTSQQNVSLHIQNIFEEGELSPAATHKKNLLVRQEGTRQVRREIDSYNLDMVISVGYRVKSLIATCFRIWATQQLREYIVMQVKSARNRLKSWPMLNMSNLPSAAESTKNLLVRWIASSNWRRLRNRFRRVTRTQKSKQGKPVQFYESGELPFVQSSAVSWAYRRITGVQSR